jgi:asparagine synthase (glutamine-hydrolysing)
MTPLAGEFSWRWSQSDERTGPEVIGWDGRIDNREDLELQLRELLRGDSSARSLIRAAYERWGIPGLGKVVGDWSVVIRDPASRRIVLASDFAGIRPLYYHQSPNALLWSNRLDHLVEKTGIEAIDERYVAGFLLVGGCPDRTPYAGIYPVPAGHAVTITAATSTTQSVWLPPTHSQIRYEDDRRYDEQFRALFREAVAVRLPADGTVMAELSGGLDSSSVVCMTNHLIRSGGHTTATLASVSYVYQGSQDVPFIKEVEAFCDLNGRHLSTDEIALVSAESISDAAPVESGPLEQATAEAARGVGARVFLTGQNGDLITGNWLDDSLQVAAPLRRREFTATVREALAWSKALKVPIYPILGRAIRAALGQPAASIAMYSNSVVSMPHNSETSLVSGLFARHGLTGADSLFSTDWLDAPPERRAHFRALTVLRELRTLQRPDALRHVDYTHPFAHRPLVEFMMSVPADVLCRPGEPRRLMRRALADLWPPKLRARRSKSLFGAAYFRSLKPMADALLEDPRWQVVERGWVERATLAARLKQLQDGLDCNEPQLRQVILLECWLRNRWPANRSQAAAHAS